MFDINIHANIQIFTSPCEACEDNLGTAWDALSNILMLVLVLEDALGIDITFSSKYGKSDEISVEKAKIRTRVGPSMLL